MATQITYKVTTETASYGSDVTVEQARTIANYIADKLYDYADQEGYDLTVEIVGHTDGTNPYEGDDSDEEAAYADIASYDEANWTDWAGEALNEQVA